MDVETADEIRDILKGIFGEIDPNARYVGKYGG